MQRVVSAALYHNGKPSLTPRNRFVLWNIANKTWSGRAEAINATRKQEYQNAVASMTPQEIKIENSKRRLLAKKYNQKTNTHIIKDPNAPKRPISAFLRFSIENRTPGAGVTEAAKEAGQRWKAMSVSDKQVCPGRVKLMKPYQQAYDADKDRYTRETAAYNKG
jgi:hypothetical protein